MKTRNQWRKKSTLAVVITAAAAGFLVAAPAAPAAMVYYEYTGSEFTEGPNPGSTGFPSWMRYARLNAVVTLETR